MTTETGEAWIRLDVFAKGLACGDWTFALATAYDTDPGSEIRPYADAKAAFIADLHEALAELTELRERLEQPALGTSGQSVSAPQRGLAPGGSALAKSEVEHRLAGLIRDTHKLLSIFGLSLTIEQERATIDATVAAIMSICGEYAIAALLALGRTG